MLRTPPPRRRRLAAVPVALAAAALLGAGCGSVGHSEGTGDRSKGKELFTQKCGSCHTLADAGTTGKIGPNLDYAFVQSRKDGLGESSIVQVVRGQIEYPDHPSVDRSSRYAREPRRGPGRRRRGELRRRRRGHRRHRVVVRAAATPAPAATARASGASGESGAGGAGDAAAGKAVFTSAGCVGCHTLADAGATGTVGPNLDEAKPDAALVVERVTNGKGPMPPFKGQLTDKQIQDVAAYVSSVAGK